MKEFEIRVHESTGNLTIYLFRNKEDKKPISVTMSLDPKQWEESRELSMVLALRELADKLETESLKL